MKPVQITFDERLLQKFDADGEVKRAGRSAVLRRLVGEYLRRRHRDGVDEAYRRAYAKKPADDLEGWEEEGAWPDEK